MNENDKFWDKKTSDLTVGDTVKLAVISPIIVMGAMMVAGTAYEAVTKLVRKVRKTKVSIDVPDKK